MRSWRGIVMGAMALALLDALVQRQGAAGRVSSWAQGAGKVVAKFLDPTVPTFATTPGSPAPSAQTQALTTPSAAPPAAATLTAPPSTVPPTTANPSITV
jgi:hypothetical protein